MINTGPEIVTHNLSYLTFPRRLKERIQDQFQEYPSSPLVIIRIIRINSDGLYPGLGRTTIWLSCLVNNPRTVTVPYQKLVVNFVIVYHNKSLERNRKKKHWKQFKISNKPKTITRKHQHSARVPERRRPTLTENSEREWRACGRVIRSRRRERERPRVSGKVCGPRLILAAVRAGLSPQRAAGSLGLSHARFLGLSRRSGKAQDRAACGSEGLKR